MLKTIYTNSQILVATIICLLFFISTVCAQTTYPVNGVHDIRDNYILIKNATIYKDAKTKINKGVILIHKGMIVGVDKTIALPQGVTPVMIDMKGKYIYPAFIDIYSAFGLHKSKKKPRLRRWKTTPQPNAKTRGPYAWNDAIRPQQDAYRHINYNAEEAANLRKSGVAVVLSHSHDGIVRGTGTLIALNDEKENLNILKAVASHHFSFDKGSSTQDYPSSLMGSIALLRQTYLDAQWYKDNPNKPEEGINISLKAFTENLSLPTIFTADDKWNAVRASRIAKEFNHPYIIKAGGTEYQNIKDIKALNISFILPLVFPEAYNLDDIHSNRFLSVKQLKHWEMAPSNPCFFQEEDIPFCFTLNQLKNADEFLKNIRKTVVYGLKESKALEALTLQPATFLGVQDKLGTLSKDKWANLVVCDGPLFEDNTHIVETWVKGNRYVHKETIIEDGYFRLTFMNNNKQQVRLVKIRQNKLYLESDKDTTVVIPQINNNLITFSFLFDEKTYSFSGILQDRYSIYGTATDEDLSEYSWKMVWTNRVKNKVSQSNKQEALFTTNDLLYPFGSYGSKRVPEPEKIAITNATVWTNTNQGIVKDADILIINGKIAAVGKNLANVGEGLRVIDGKGKHITPGIIDEHSHIALTRGVNEGTQAVTSEVRIGDVINPDDINIYRQLSGGVTTSHILHGSANPIGGQTQLIKLRWGKNAEEMKFKSWTPFIKFALGENVKQSNWGDYYKIRFPQTRMGVEQIMDDAFSRAKEYASLKNQGAAVKPDLELDALVEILNKKRFITCHSYIQSEITMMMRLAEKYDFVLNTFTHILEGYKVADKIKKHGANASTFSDWGTYKYEVNDAITYNAAIMHKLGVNVAINSDDAEMARRLNQEAAKLVRYGGISEEDALKTVTLNPAKMLHIDDRVGSVDVGKDADIVIWSANPLSIYAKVEKTIIDGIVYYDKDINVQLQQNNRKEKSRLLKKMKDDNSASSSKKRPILFSQEMYNCEGLIKSSLLR